MNDEWGGHIYEWTSGFDTGPLEACVFGAVRGWRKDTDYPGTVEALILAGSRYTAEIILSGDEVVDTVLRRHLRSEP